MFASGARKAIETIGYRGKKKEKAIDDLEMTVVRCKPETISTLCKSTKFNKEEIKRIYQGFKQVHPSVAV
ncbi:hypothetical protein HPB50_025343 [Hyalomma asiaticum]|uniref:Uncharacterized protein n=1 Tax=Hyalomma asiaticum TaxID=266040 RepID=A0ACB7RWN4_HYAAI|nr:hypothetical protein HPB50_025343 [Hyalomma asiaticum]